MQIDKGIEDKIFEVDGSQRDIYVRDIDIVVWGELLDLIKKTDWQPQLYKDGYQEKIDNYSARQIFDEKNDFAFTLTFEFKGIKVYSHFFDENELEFDISPKEISTLRQRSAVFQFMQFLSRTFEKNVSITPENSPENPFLSISPEGTVTVHH